MPANKVARQFGLTYRVPAAQEAIYRRAFVNLPFTNGDDSWELPIPATFIVDRDSTILYASANEDYTDRPEPMEILDAAMRSRRRDVACNVYCRQRPRPRRVRRYRRLET